MPISDDSPKLDGTATKPVPKWSNLPASVQTLFFAAARASLAADTATKPEWDRKARRLSFAGELAKRIKNASATNVLLVLDAFAEVGWPARIDDPFPAPGLNDPDQQERLKDVVASLNAGLKLLRFHRGGDGESIIWERV